MERLILTMTCPDQPGIVRAVAEGITAADGNIVESSQYTDPDSDTFCLRTAFDTSRPAEAVREMLTDRLDRFDPVLGLRREQDRRKALIMVSRYDHCLDDLLYRWKRDELPVDLPLVVSNHPDLRELVEREGIPFVHLPVTRDTKPQAEARLLELVAEHDVDFIVLARYMQVLSDDLCRRMSGRVINIHHSFLPGFKGAKPYHQARARGVKLIGATAHYVTADLDEGPIIEQDVTRVSHSHEADQLVVLGRDVERSVLSRAVRLHAEDRVVLTGHHTVVFA